MSPYKDIILLLTIFSTMYIFIPGTHLFSTRSLFLNLPHQFLSSAHHPSLWQPPVYYLYHLWLCFFFVMYIHLFCFLDPHKCELIQYLSFSVWLILFSTVPSRSTHVVESGKFLLLLWLSNIPLCTYIHTHTHTHTQIVFIHLSVDGT